MTILIAWHFDNWNYPTPKPFLDAYASQVTALSLSQSVTISLPDFSMFQVSQTSQVYHIFQVFHISRVPHVSHVSYISSNTGI